MSTYTLSFNSKLTEDYIHSDTISASSTALTPMATFLNSQQPPQSEALLINQSGELCHLQREPLSSSGWNIYGIGATVATFAAANSGTAWILGMDQTIWQSNAGHWNYVGTLASGDPTFSVGLDGTVYAVGAPSGGVCELYLYDAATGQFQSSGTTQTFSAPVGAPGSLWGTSANNQVLMNGPDAWAPAPVLPNGDLASQVDAGNDGSIFVLALSGAIYSYDAGSQGWEAVAGVPTGATSIAVLSAQVIYVQAAGAVQAFLNEAWSALPATPYELESISVGNDGTLWALSHYGSVWQYKGSAWLRQMMPTDLSGTTGGHQVTEVVTGRHSDGNQYAFYVMNGTLYYSMLDETKAYGGYWTEGVQIYNQPCSNLGVTTAWAQDSLMVYGVTANGEFLMVEDKAGWAATVLVPEGGGKVPVQTCQFTSPTAGSWCLFVTNGTEMGWSELAYGGLLPLRGLSLAGNPALTQIIPFPITAHGSVQGGVYTCALDAEGQLWFINAPALPEATATQISGGAGCVIGKIVSATIVASDQTGSVTSARIFARDENNMLWIIRFTMSNKFATWGEWHPLGDACLFLANGPTTATTGDLFMLDEGGEVAVLSEDVDNEVWNELIMLKPQGTTDDAQYVSRYVNEITIVDENGKPMPNFDVSVTADIPCGVWVGTTLYNVGETVPAVLTTNQTGQVTFGFFAGDLHTPTFSFSADGLATPPTIYPAQAVQNYLAGQSDALPGRPVFDAAGTTLSGATMQTSPDWEPQSSTSFVPANNASNAGMVATAVTQAFQVQRGTGASGQWSAPSSLSAGGLGSSAFWNDLCKFGRDIDHAIKKAAIQVGKVTVDLVNKVVQIVVQIGNSLETTILNLVVNTIQDVVSAVKSAFRAIGRAVDEAIHWLKALFAWGDVINTKRVLEAGIMGLLERLEENFDQTSQFYVGKLFDNAWNDDVIGSVKAGFANAMQKFAKNPSGPQQTPATVSSQTPYPASGAPMGSDACHPTGLTNAQSSNGTHTNYVHHHVTNYSNNGGALPAPPAQDGLMADLFSAIQDKLLNNSNFTPMESAGNLQQVFADPKAFADVVIYDILNAIQDGVVGILDVIQAVLDELFALAAIALEAFQKLLTVHIDIPVISWLYTKISGGDPLTILDLMCLMMAVPTTIVYKLTFGLPNATAPFSAADVAAAQAAYGAGNFPWPAAGGGSATMVNGLLRQDQPNLGSFPFAGAGILMVLNGAVYALFDALNDLTAQELNVANEGVTEANKVSDPITTFFSWTSIFTTLVGQWLTAPFDLFGTSNYTKAEQMTLSLWSLNFLPWTYNLVFMFVPPGYKIARYNSDFGVWVDTAVGLMLAGVGIATTVEQIEDTKKEFGPCYWVQNLIAPLPTIFKPLTTITNQPAGAVATAVLCVGDGVLDMANCALGFVEDAV